VEDRVPRTSARRIRYFTPYREGASFIVVREAPRSIGAKIGNHKFIAPRDWHDIMRMRALLTTGVGPGTIELHHCARRRVEEVWR
jgi:hypothetical protein